jgi:hypothetical protein
VYAQCLAGYLMAYALDGKIHTRGLKAKYTVLYKVATTKPNQGLTSSASVTQFECAHD